MEQGRGITIPSSQLRAIYNSIGIAMSPTSDGGRDGDAHFSLNRDTLDLHENKCVLFAQTNSKAASVPTVEAMMAASGAVRRDWECIWGMATDLPRDSGSWGSCSIS